MFPCFFSTTTYPPNPKPKTQTPGTKTPKASSPGAHLVEHQKGISRGKKSDNVKNMIDMETLCVYIYIYDKYHLFDNVTIYHHIIHNICIDRYKSKYHWRYIIIYRSYDIYIICHISPCSMDSTLRLPSFSSTPTPTACLHPPSISRV